jgi:hypothetical protein
MTITPTTVPEAGGARLRRAMGAGRRKELGLSAPRTRTATPTRFRFFDGVCDLDMT